MRGQINETQTSCKPKCQEKEVKQSALKKKKKGFHTFNILQKGILRRGGGGGSPQKLVQAKTLGKQPKIPIQD